MLNQITIMGRLVRDPELRFTAAGKPVANFNVAVERDFINDGQREADFIEVVAWNTVGEFVSKYFRKGSMIAVVGRLQSRKWEDSSGNKRTSWEVKADSVYFADSKKSESNTATTATPQTFVELPDDDSQLPF